MAKKNKIEDLRDHLFEVIEMLKDGDIEIETAKAIKAVGDTIVNSAKIEIQFINATKNTQIKSNFIPQIETKEQKYLTDGASGDELPDCKCGDPVYPSDADKSTILGLDYARCKTCLSLLPAQLDHARANGGANA